MKSIYEESQLQTSMHALRDRLSPARYHTNERMGHSLLPCWRIPRARQLSPLSFASFNTFVLASLLGKSEGDETTNKFKDLCEVE